MNAGYQPTYPNYGNVNRGAYPTFTGTEGPPPGQATINLSQYKKGGHVFCCLVATDAGGNTLLRLCASVDEATLARAQTMAMRVLSKVHDRLHAMRKNGGPSVGAEVEAALPKLQSQALATAFDRVKQASPQMPSPDELQALSVLPTLSPRDIPSTTQKALAARELIRKIVSVKKPHLADHVRRVLSTSDLVDSANKGDARAVLTCQKIVATVRLDPRRFAGLIRMLSSAMRLHRDGSTPLNGGPPAMTGPIAGRQPPGPQVYSRIPDVFGVPAVSGAEEIEAMGGGVYVHPHQVLPQASVLVGGASWMPEHYGQAEHLIEQMRVRPY